MLHPLTYFYIGIPQLTPRHIHSHVIYGRRASVTICPWYDLGLSDVFGQFAICRTKIRGVILVIAAVQKCS